MSHISLCFPDFLLAMVCMRIYCLSLSKSSSFTSFLVQRKGYTNLRVISQMCKSSEWTEDDFFQVRVRFHLVGLLRFFHGFNQHGPQFDTDFFERKQQGFNTVFIRKHISCHLKSISRTHFFPRVTLCLMNIIGFLFLLLSTKRDRKQFSLDIQINTTKRSLSLNEINKK